MPLQATPPLPARARILAHPGPVNPIRIHSRSSPGASHLRLRLPSGASLFDALVRPLARLGIHNASTTLLGGSFEKLSYCTAPPDPSRQAVIAYTAPIECGPGWLVFGNATLGKTETGAPLVHCHAVFRTGRGELRGGHVMTQASIVGACPVTVLVTTLDDVELRVAFDAETNIPLMQPRDAARREDHHGSA